MAPPATIPLRARLTSCTKRSRSGGTTGFGAWNLHGGVEYQALGDTTKALNGDDGSRVIGSVGIGFVY